MSKNTSARTAKYAIVIGRFQPLHKGHEHLISKALEIADNVVVLIGSAGEPRTPKNPWTYEERAEMVRLSFPNVECRPIYDFKYTELAWVEQVQGVIAELEGPLKHRVVLVGHEKDKSSYYLKVFPQTDFIEAGMMRTAEGLDYCLDATTIREYIFNDEITHLIGLLNPAIYSYLADIQYRDETKVEDFRSAKLYYQHIQKYKKAWANAPYPPTFVTVDAIVVQSGHVLLVQRGDHPGKGLWALPGGFLNVDERIVDGMVRELYEETVLKVQEKILRRCIVDTQVFDDPNRSLRGRTITHAFLIKLDDHLDLPRVTGSDDAAKAWWFPIAEVRNMRSKLFDDHFEIIISMLNRLDTTQ